RLAIRAVARLCAWESGLWSLDRDRPGFRWSSRFGESVFLRKRCVIRRLRRRTEINERSGEGYHNQYCCGDDSKQPEPATKLALRRASHLQPTVVRKGFDGFGRFDSLQIEMWRRGHRRVNVRFEISVVF